MSTHRFAATAALAAVLLSVPTAHAQESLPTSFQVEQFEPLHAQGTNALNLAKSEVLNELTPSFGVFVHYVDDPLELVDEDGVTQARVVGSQLKAELWAALGLFGIADLGLVMPLVLTQSGDASSFFENAAISGFTTSDLRIVPKLRVLDPESAAGVGIALMGTVWVPTGDDGSFNSEGTVRGEPRLVVDYTIADVVVLFANAGFQFRPTTQARNYTSGDTVRWGAGVDAALGGGVSAIATIFGASGIEAGRNPVDLATTAANDRAHPIEADLAFQYALPANLVASLGGGLGLNSSVGAPDYRVFASFGYTPRVVDTDGDGLLDPDDGCPEEPEDVDDFEDSDGCPDPDNDGDGILDPSDQCPMEAEDADGFEDADGCPDPDNDADGIPDVEDRCPNEPGVPEKQGCPLTDADGDGILDDVDKCPNEPEDVDTHQDEDGCPDPDNDGDGFLDPDDKCPFEPETINGNQDDDGCPDEGKSKVRVTKTKIEILEKVFFDTNKDTIKPVSYDVLNQVALVLKSYPKITLVRVEGYTDSRGSDAHNLDLSQRRANSVRQYLIAQGIDENRLVAKGYGEELPIADNKTAAGREKNRRVEFLIREVDGKPVEEGGAVIETREPAP